MTKITFIWGEIQVENAEQTLGTSVAENSINGGIDEGTMVNRGA